MTAEEWRPIAEFPGYEVSDQGRVLSTKYGRRKVMGLTKGDPYPRVMFCVNNQHFIRRVHRLVALAFHGPTPEGCEVRHLNDNPKDNRAENLAWGTRSENLRDCVRNGLHYWAKRETCPRGHEFTPENTYIRVARGSSRVCKTCHRKRTREYQAKVRAADPEARNVYQREWRARRALAATP